MGCIFSKKIKPQNNEITLYIRKKDIFDDIKELQELRDSNI